MPKQPKNAPMDIDEMAAMQEKRSGSKIYKVESDEHKKEEFSTLTGAAADRIKATVQRGKIELSTISTQELAHHIDNYFQACVQTGTIPSFVSLGHSLGYSTSGLYRFINGSPTHPNTELLEMAREEFASIIDSASMMGNLAPAPAIFVLKSLYGRKESIELIASPAGNGPLGDSPNIQDITQYRKQLEAGLTDD